MDQELIKREFPLVTKISYLNSASTGILPICSKKAIEEFLNCYTTRDINNEKRTFSILEECKENVAKLIHCDTDEISFQPNTSYGVNTIANAINWQKGDRIIIPDKEFPANVIPWKNLEEKGVIIDLIPRTGNISHCICEAIKKETKLIAVSAISFSDGDVLDLKRLSKIARKNKIFFFVDAIQALGNFPLFVDEIDIDFMACGAQKWLISPWGSGFLYISKNVQEQLNIPFQGWLSRFPERDFTDLLNYDKESPHDASRFEVGTLVFPSLIGMNESIKLINSIMIDRIHLHNRKLVKTMSSYLERMGDFEILTDIENDRFSSIITFRSNNSEELYSRLVKKDVYCSFRENAIRLSFHFYNTLNDIDKVLEILK